MSTTAPLGSMEHARETAEVVAGGSTVEAAAGVAALVLGSLGLAGVVPLSLAAIASIAAGAGLLSEGLAVMTRHWDLRPEASGRSRELRLGMALEVLGGIAGITLGIIALAGASPWSLLGVAALVFGASLMAGAGEAAAVERSPVEVGPEAVRPSGRRGHEHAAKAAAGPQMLVGIGSLTLGALALSGIATHALILIAFLSVGVATLLAGSVVTSRFLPI